MPYFAIFSAEEDFCENTATFQRRFVKKSKRGERRFFKRREDRGKRREDFNIKGRKRRENAIFLLFFAACQLELCNFVV